MNAILKDNKGYAISAVMYSLLILVIVLLFSTLALMSNRKEIIDKINSETKKELDDRVIVDDVGDGSGGVVDPDPTPDPDPDPTPDPDPGTCTTPYTYILNASKLSNNIYGNTTVDGLFVIKPPVSVTNISESFKINGSNVTVSKGLTLQAYGDTYNSTVCFKAPSDSTLYLAGHSSNKNNGVNLKIYRNGAQLNTITLNPTKNNPTVSNFAVNKDNTYCIAADNRNAIIYYMSLDSCK